MTTTPLTLADDNTLQDLLLAVAVKAARDTRDMMTDMLSEKEYIKEHGIPNKDDFRNFAVGFLVDTYPEQASEWLKVEAASGESAWTVAWTAAVTEVVRRWPMLTKLTVDLK